MSSVLDRQILHIDMDAFFAAVEQRDNPELRGRPVLVGGDPNSRGVVSAASYEARKFGCHSALPMSRALRLCPQAAIVHPRMGRYAEVSQQVFAIFERFTPLVEPLSIDEAFLDVTGCQRLFGTGVEIARQLKLRVREETQLGASVGVAPNKFLAKIASDLRKPDGLVVVPPDAIQEFLDPLPLKRLWGAGAVTLKRFEELGVHTFGDARRLHADQLRGEFGSAGTVFHSLLRGLDERPIVTDREAKSISHEYTFAVDIDDMEHVRAVLLGLLEQVAARLRRQARLARNVTVKIRTGDFNTITRGTMLDTPTDRTDEFWHAAVGLFDAWAAAPLGPVRLIGVGVSHLGTESSRQLSLFEQPDDKRQRALDRAADEIRARFGSAAIRRGGAQPPNDR